MTQLNIPLEGVNRYNPQNIPALEDYVRQQCQDESYNLNSNLALLKLYQFNPQTCNVDVVCKVLLKALIRFPDSDLLLCLALLSEQVMEDESVKRILALSDSLETANIPQIWPSLEACSSLTTSLKGFTDAIRKCISVTVSITCQTISLAQLQAYFHLDENATKAFVAQLGWAADKGVVQIPLNSENQSRPNVYQEDIKFEQLTKMIGHSSF